MGLKTMDIITDTSLILWLQQCSPYLDWPFRLVTALGNESFFLLFLPLVYWCIDRRMGAGLAVLFLISASLNAVAKAVFGMPRPFAVDSAVMQLASAQGNGFPSGHTQGAMVVWLYLAARAQKNWLWWLAGGLIVLIPVSRLYLGVHFPVDLCGGYILGGGLVVIFLKTEQPVAAMLESRSTALLLTVLVVIAGVSALWAKDQGDYVISTVAALTGTGCGMVMERRWVRFAPRTRLRQQLVCYLAGIIGLLVIYVGLKIGFAGIEPAWLLRFLRYGLVGMWVAAGAPWLFKRTAPRG